MKNVLLILNFTVSFMLLNLNASNAQDVKHNSQMNKSLFSSGRLVLVGEIHTYGYFRYGKKTQEMLSTHKNFHDFKYSLYQYLQDSLNFNHFVFEFPISDEYFLKKYFRTGNLEYLSAYREDSVFCRMLNLLYEKNKFNPKFQIHCVDHEDKSMYNETKLSLLLILCDALDCNINYIGSSIFNDIRNSIINNDIFKSKPQYELMSKIINCNKKLLYKICLNLSLDIKLNELKYKALVYNDFDLFKRIINSYIYCYESKKKSLIIERQNRELFIYNELDKDMNIFKNEGFFFSIGKSHIQNNWAYLYGRKYNNYKVFFDILNENQKLKSLTKTFLCIYEFIEPELTNRFKECNLTYDTIKIPYFIVPENNCTKQINKSVSGVVYISKFDSP